ncbi:hypothetical protein ACFFGR_17150 [Arthrobacter liuii]|uniref:Uncharacterized protein n=1 Tax=Arthrobacter liuii TaxID=1476996 RepID=A0ABQ2B0U7_9MICC|nr:hypothetical protein [Arthrobacter liuii]GGI01630.1 hypothetical protein GCM10007170_41510 [Arthrobacter liuii]
MAETYDGAFNLCRKGDHREYPRRTEAIALGTKAGGPPSYLNDGGPLADVPISPYFPGAR